MATTPDTDAVIHLNDNSLFAELWVQRDQNPLEFTDREKHLYTSPMFLNAVIEGEKAKKIALRLSAHPLLACCHVKYPTEVHFRIRKQERVIEEILAPAMTRGLIGSFRLKTCATRSITYDLSFIKGFDRDGALHCLDMENFVYFIDKLVENIARTTPADTVINAIAGRNLLDN